MVLRDRGYADIKDVNLQGQQDNNVVITVVEALEEEHEE